MEGTNAKTENDDGQRQVYIPDSGNLILISKVNLSVEQPFTETQDTSGPLPGHVEKKGTKRTPGSDAEEDNCMG